MTHGGTAEPRAHGGVSAAFDLGGELGARMRDLDWSQTPLGRVASWPQSLVSCVSILLSSKAQIVAFWGAEYVALYNDAYAPTIGDKHPRALGRPARENWAELWDTLEPMLASVRDRGEAFSASDHPFQIDRRGFIEDVYFDISYDPVRVEDGSVGGVFCIVSETTKRVLGERRLALLSSVSAQLANATDSASVVKGFLGAVGTDQPDVPFVRLVQPDEWSEGLTVAGVLGTPPAGLDHVTPSVEEADLDADGNPPGRGGPVAAVRVPLRAGAVDLGAVVLGVNPRYDLDEEYRRFLRFLAERLATGLLNARIYENDHRVAATLQRAILPDRLADQPGLELDSRYLPATAGLDVGGDWYDSLLLPGGSVALVIGDVAGKGVQAAALMGQLRNALRAYLLDGREPADALLRLNRLTMRLESWQFATVLCAVLDPATGALRWSNAGHLPPLWLPREGQASYLQARPGPPIGVTDAARYGQHDRRLDVGDSLAMFTDGLVEERDEALDVGLRRAAEAASGAGSAAELVTRLSRLREPSRRHDDTAVLAARLVGRA